MNNDKRKCDECECSLTERCWHVDCVTHNTSFSGEHPDTNTQNAGDSAHCNSADIANATNTPWELCIGKGWDSILTQAIEQVKKLPCLSIVDVKEKWGELRLYVEHNYKCTGTDAEIDAHFDKAIAIENQAALTSRKTCEHCGKAAQLRPDGWIKTLCDECASSG